MRLMAKAVEALQQMPRLTRLLKESRGLINTTDLLVATAATVILAAGVGSAAISTMNDAKYGKAQPDAQAIGNAITQFYKDTGKWPGQAEQTDFASGGSGPLKALFLVTTSTTISALLPTNFAAFVDTPVPPTGSADAAISVGLAVCKNNSLEGFIGKSIAAGTLATATLKDINDYLVRKPGTSYQRWNGPYLQQDIQTDPWDRAWVINLQPLYCSELIASGTTTTYGALGFAWALSGGTNRTVTTTLLQAHLDTTGDDTGISMGKLITRVP